MFTVEDWERQITLRGCLTQKESQTYNQMLLDRGLIFDLLTFSEMLNRGCRTAA